MPLLTRVTERLVYIDQNDVPFDLHAPPTRVVEQVEGMGMPPIEYVTERGPVQHGVTVKEAFLQPRVIQITVRHSAPSRNGYWANRSLLLDAIRFNKGPTLQPGELRQYRSDGTTRSVEVLISDGPGFTPVKRGWDEWSFLEVLRFVAHDPVVYGPDWSSFAFASQGGAAVVSFPITFPITFGGFSGTGGFTYAGTWLSYPIVRMNGPLTSPQIRNTTTNELLLLNTTVAAGRTATWDLTFEHKTVTLDDGTRLTGFVDPSSDISTFHLVPGMNNFQVTASGASLASSIVLEWKTCYIGY